MPFVDRYYGRRETEKLYRLAAKSASRNFPFHVQNSGWATQRCLADIFHRNLTNQLVNIDLMTGATSAGGIARSLHWSRRYEYPYAIMNITTEPSKTFKILDCGGGLGSLQFYLAMKGYTVHSVDLNLKSLARIVRIKSKKKIQHLYPTYGNILDLPFPNDHFDNVLCISVLEHVLYRLKQDTSVILKGVVNELVRVLKPTGRVILTFDVNMAPEKSNLRLYHHEYEALCKILGILPVPTPINRLFSSDTPQGRQAGKSLCVYCVTFTKSQQALNVYGS